MSYLTNKLHDRNIRFLKRMRMVEAFLGFKPTMGQEES